jgi:hypothetical protein
MDNTKKKVIIISYLPLNREPRVLRQVQALKDNYKLYTIGYNPIDDPDIVFYPISDNILHKRTFIQKVKRRLKRYLSFFELKNIYHKKIENQYNFKYILSHSIERPDVIIAHDWAGLLLASTLKKSNNWKANIYLDAHEYSPNQFSASIEWRLFTKPLIIWALKKCKNDFTIMSAVCEGIAREYENFFRFPYNSVTVITNAANYHANLRPNDIQNNKIKLIHHGYTMVQRRLDLMIKMMKYLDPEKYELTFMLINSQPQYYNYLINEAESCENIKFIEPVPFNDIINKLNNYDIGLFLLLPENFNYKLALPNKFFEFIQARLAVAIGPSIEMKKIVSKYNIGVCSNDFTPESLAESISKMSFEQIMECKKNSHLYARELSSLPNLELINNIISGLEVKNGKI